MTPETRRAAAAWLFQGADGREDRGSAEAVIDDSGLSVGPVRASFLDVDSLAVEGRSIVLGL